MLGIAKGAGGYQAPTPPPDVKASISPSSLLVSSSDGSYTSPFFKAAVSNGVGPFTYSWAIDDGDMLTPGKSKSRAVVEGYRTIKTFDISLTVTDTGDGNKTATASARLVVEFGEIL